MVQFKWDIIQIGKFWKKLCTWLSPAYMAWLITSQIEVVFSQT